MKRYIRATKLSGLSYNEAPEDVQNNEHLYELDPDLFEETTESIYSYNLDCSDRRSKGGYVIYLNGKYKRKKLHFVRRCPLTEEDINQICNEVLEDLRERIVDRQNSLNLTKERRSAGLKKMSANQYTLAVLRNELGMIRTDFASPKNGSAFMLYELPFTNSDDSTIDTEFAQEFKDDFMSILNELEDNYGFHYYDVKTPIGGSIIRSKWSYVVFGPDLLVKKNSLDVVKILNNED